MKEPYTPITVQVIVLQATDAITLSKDYVLPEVPF